MFGGTSLYIERVRESETSDKRKMETTKTFPLSEDRLGKIEKSVTWSENLTNIKMMTPQTSVIENMTDIVIYEEEEKVEELAPFRESSGTFVDSLVTQVENIQNKENDDFQCLEKCKKSDDYSLKGHHQDNQSQNNFQDEHKSLDKSLQKIFGTTLHSSKLVK